MRVRFVLTPMEYDGNKEADAVTDLSEKEIDTIVYALEQLSDKLGYLMRIDMYRTSKYPKKMIGKRLI